MAFDVSRLRAMATKVVVPYASEYAQLHADFAARMWPGKQRRCDPHYNRWKFRGPDQGPVAGHLLAVRSGKVVGQIGSTPVEAQVGNHQYHAQWMCDLMVEPAWRLMGIAPLLVAQATNRKALSLAFNPPPKVVDIFEALGFRKLLGPVRMLLPLNATHFLSESVNGSLRRFVPTFAFLARPLIALRARKLRHPANGEQVTNNSWEALVETIEEAQRRVSAPHVIHDRAFLQWRCPGLQTYSQSMRGLHTADGSYLLFGEDLPFLYVYDWASANEAETRALFAQLWFLGQQAGAKTISVLANSDQEQQWLRELGFLTMRRRTCIYYFAAENIPLTLERFHFCHYDSHANL